MDKLPVELIENILKSPKLTIEDVINFSSTCHYFRYLVLGSNSVWKQKFREKWPECVLLFDNNYEKYFDEVAYVYKLRRMALHLLEEMPAKFYKKYEISDSDLQQWYDLLQERPQVYRYLVTYLMEIVNTNTPINSIEVVPLNTPGNKTLQYYAGKVLRYVRQVHLSHVWKEYTGLPADYQILEKGAVLVAQWCQPNLEISWASISRCLDVIADRMSMSLSIIFTGVKFSARIPVASLAVIISSAASFFTAVKMTVTPEIKHHLHTINPIHSLFKATPADIAKWREKNLHRNQWNVAECRQVIRAIKEVMYGEMGFTGNNVAYYMPQNSFINEVLDKRRGLPITLAIAYIGVARRLGLRCDPINSPAHFLLRFIESDEQDSDWYYIDVFNDGNIVRANACPQSRYGCSKREPLPAATAAQVVERMANNLEVSARQHTHPNGRITRLRSALELLKLVNPCDISALVSLARLYMLHNMDTRPLEAFLLEQQFEVPEQAWRVVHMLRDYDAHHQRQEQELFRVEAAQRTLSLKFAVGMVMTHLALNYRCVIYDWDPVCLASADWQRQMNVAQLTLADQQPFYNVLAEDGSHRYVAQENLRPADEPSAASHLSTIEDLGRHFSHFFHTHFVPNTEKEQEYPADRKVRHSFYYKQQLENISLQ